MNYNKIYKMLFVSSIILATISIIYIIFSTLNKIDFFGFFIACFSLIVSLIFIFEGVEQVNETKKDEKQTQTNVRDIYLYYQLLEPPDMNN